MLGLATGTILAIIGLAYILDYVGFLEKIPVADLFSGRVPKHWAILLVALVVTGSGFGVISLDNVSSDDIKLPTANIGEGQTYGADVSLIVAGTTGADFADSGYDFYLLDYNKYQGVTGYEIMQDIIDSGTGVLVGPGGNTAVPETISSGKVTWDDMEASIGDKFIVFGYDDTTPAAGDYEILLETIEIKNYNAEQGTFVVSPNRFQLYTFGAVDSYNFASTDITGYQEDEDAAVNGLLINFDLYNNADNNVSRDMGLFIEIPSAMQSEINKITVKNDDGVVGTFSSFNDVANMDTSNPIFESAPAKQTAGNSLYYVGQLPDMHRTSSTAKDKINIEIDYDHLGTGTNVVYVYATQLTNGGGDMHFDIAANPAFALNVTAVGTDGWATA